jgi:Carboxypeptidase regulatory-like domain
MKSASRTIAILMFLFLLSASLLAQSTGVIKGQVTDPSGAVVTDATVTAKSAGGQVFTAATNKQGNYEIKGLAPGKYAISVVSKGFSKYETQDLAIEAGHAQQLDIALDIAVKSEEVEVQDTTTQVDVAPSNNASAIVLKGKDLDALSDDPDDLAADLQALAGPSAGPNGGQIYIDGFTNGQLPPKSAIREVRINTNPFSAEYDHIGYGRIEIFTKPGTDKFHGQAMFNFNNQIFNARNPFNHGDQPGYQSEMYNANVGGPLSKKASFFFSVQRRKQDETSIINAVVLDNNFNQVPFSTAVPNPVTRMEIGPRIDYQLTKRNALTVRYEFNRNESQNGGISTFTLPTLGMNSNSTNHQLQISDNQILSDTMLFDTRFQYSRNRNSSTALSFAPYIAVPGAFNAGGNTNGVSQDHTDRYELQNYLRMTRGKHLITVGGRFRAVRDANDSTSGYNGSFNFDSLTAYQITQQGLAQGLTAAQIRAAGGGASQFRITSGQPLVSVSQEDAGVFAEDTWTVRPNITVTTGLRFETQNNIGNRFNLAPRIGFAWGLGRVKNGPAKTVLRLGTGIFYDRFSEGLVMTAQRLNGITQQNYIVTNPDFFPNVPAVSALTGALSSLTTYQIAPNLHAPYVIQSAASVEHQLTKTATIAVTYLHSEGRHQLLTHNINAPLPGTYTGPGTGTRPLGGNNNVYEFASEGVFDQNQLITNANVRIGARVSLNSFYMLNYASGNSSGSNSFPVNQYSLANEYGRTAFDVRQRFFITGNISAPWGIRFNPFVTVSSGNSFNITLGHDLNGDSIINDRPVFATTSACDGKIIVCTPWGIFDTVSTTGKAIPVNYGTGHAQFSINLRVSKTIGFGPSLNAEANRGNRGGGGDHGPGGGGGDHGPGGGGGGGRPGGGMVRMGGGGPMGGAGGTGKRYNLTFSLNANNLFNHVNPSVPVGNLSSPLFGTSNSLAGGGFGGGGQAANRRVTMQVQFAF